ncbi:hypothetical protein FYK55_01510 [Roseiconus nitratireducens]|uniref:Uncharacterized protein n=1 Tax=Roseiconus nitratireducens TaxID=2605748 RepID=A0A5M6DLJ0_9BACT|nr:hypothetical protein [Roseiconus nitratireducens]KAA5547122.1 hypothetical protein FYK55_01510 [Roseiconus nitratireducens]
MSSHAHHPLTVESDAHVASRHFQTAVRVLLVIALIATIGCLAFYRQAAYLPAIAVPVLYTVLAIVNYLETRSRAENLRRPGQSELSGEEWEIDVQTVGIITVFKCLLAIAVGMLLVASALFDWEFVGGVAACGFLIAVLMNLPFLTLFFSESEKDELDKLNRESDQS